MQIDQFIECEKIKQKLWLINDSVYLPFCLYYLYMIHAIDDRNCDFYIMKQKVLT
jgi:hypothetical protein